MIIPENKSKRILTIVAEVQMAMARSIKIMGDKLSPNARLNTKAKIIILRDAKNQTAPDIFQADSDSGVVFSLEHNTKKSKGPLQA